MTNEEMIEKLESDGLSSVSDMDFITEALQDNTKLKAENEQLKSELERSIKLPCKVGDIIYKANKASETVRKHKVIKIDYELNDVGFTCQIWFENYNFCFAHHFGKTIFLTREEAEEAVNYSGTSPRASSL